ncbi:hypothetical protein Acife_1974 [Acidithiobacillus ferrivorans SS3]|uniref:Uncharacterized protein n=1 Tax=Acidithiobacillus ferrivorans SS3 TaxID=743299 RepID=G0JLP6_9PROT|nr:hypothetical protein [Acidithiobacillus ferrivorans]AEM48095.1 hypothetical protein Acife_1974 [Acidithiobacillus ferrivorans SS3]
MRPSRTEPGFTLLKLMIVVGCGGPGQYRCSGNLGTDIAAALSAAGFPHTVSCVTITDIGQITP